MTDFGEAPTSLPPRIEALGTREGRSISASRSIGAILVDCGRLSPSDAERILQTQKETGVRFGDAAVLLGLLNNDDIRHALAHQSHYPYLPPGHDSVDHSLEITCQPFVPAGEDFRTLRTQLKLGWFDTNRERKMLAVVSSGRHEGRSHVVANLAIVFSQLGKRTLVVDADLRHPSQSRLFRLAGQTGLSDMLSGRCSIEAAIRPSPLRYLSVLPSGIAPPNPQELLAGDAFSTLLPALCQDFEVVILDTPNSAEFADAHTVAKRAGGAVLVARQHASSLPGAASLVRNLQQHGITIVGSVFNQG
jgi:protein-tyrosine kinase